MGINYQIKGLDRLVYKILLQAVRDVYSKNELRSMEAKVWLREYGVQFAVDCNSGMSVQAFEAWIRGGFEMAPEKITYLQKAGAAGPAKKVRG
jgi:hypothetical protein